MLTFHFQVAGVLLGAVLGRRRKVIDIWRISPTVAIEMIDRVPKELARARIGAFKLGIF